MSISSGDPVFLPGGKVDITVSYIAQDGKRFFSMMLDREKRFPATELKLAHAGEMKASIDCIGANYNMRIAGTVVSCECTRVQRGRWHVRTPCCSGGRYVRDQRLAVQCPYCRWHWHVVIGQGLTRWISYGY